MLPLDFRDLSNKIKQQYCFLDDNAIFCALAINLSTNASRDKRV